MASKVRKAVLAALKRNTFTADQPIEVRVKGTNVLLVGEVEDEALIYEAVATAESVSALLRVYSRLKVRQTAPVREKAGVI
jgi:osmotically-inducible protein OsmY